MDSILIKTIKQLPNELSSLVLSYLPVRNLNYTFCMDQIKDLDTTHKVYQSTQCTGYESCRHCMWNRWSFIDFSLHKNRDKKIINNGLLKLNHNLIDFLRKLKIINKDYKYMGYKYHRIYKLRRSKIKYRRRKNKCTYSTNN